MIEIAARGIAALALLALGWPLAVSAAAGGPGGGAAGAEAVTAAIEQARDAGGAFHLLAHCTDEEGIRSLEVFPGGVAIWNGRAQLTLDGEERDHLLDLLLQKGFPALDESYGGKRPPPPRPETEAPPEAAALRVRCRLTFESGEIAKTSIQQAQGEQSPALTGLLDALLDYAEPRAAERGTGAEDLADGLAKLAAGKLAPETFALRFVRLPEGTAEEPGSIVRLEHGTLTRRPYTPGREVGEPATEELGRDRLAELVERLRQARLDALPANLWAPDRLELEVRVLDHRETVIARPFRGLAPNEKGEDQKRFDALVSYLRAELLGGGEAALAGEAAVP